jgi:hypothetical protein
MSFVSSVAVLRLTYVLAIDFDSHYFNGAHYLLNIGLVTSKNVRICLWQLKSWTFSLVKS